MMRCLPLVCLLALLPACAGVTLPPIVIPTPPPGPVEPPAPPPAPECLPGVPWCHELVPPASCGQCKHQPPGGSCRLAPPCAPPPPAPPTCTNVDCVPGYHCEETLLGPVCLPDPPPPAGGCSIDGEPGPALPDHRPTLGPEINAAMAALRPDCDPGGRCVLEESRQSWQARVIAELRRRGLCAGQHEPSTDEIAAATSATSPREGWHVYAGPWDGPGTVVWSPQAARLAYAAPSSPPPPTSPPGDACPLPHPDRSRLYLEAKIGRQWIDATVQTVGTLDYCTEIGMSPMDSGALRASCPMRSECPGYQCEQRQACELYAMGGAYDWQTTPPGLVIHHPDNPALAQCRDCEAIRVCAADGAVCSEWVLSSDGTGAGVLR